MIKECESPDQGGLYSCCAAILALVFCIFPGMVYLRNSITSFVRKLQANQAAANIRKVQRQEICENPEGSVEEQLGNIQWPESNIPTNTFHRRGSFRGETGPQGRRHTETLREAFSMHSVGAIGGAMGGSDDYPTLHRTSGSLKPRPSTIHESSHPTGAYSRLTRE